MLERDVLSYSGVSKIMPVRPFQSESLVHVGSWENLAFQAEKDNKMYQWNFWGLHFTSKQLFCPNLKIIKYKELL